MRLRLSVCLVTALFLVTSYSGSAQAASLCKETANRPPTAGDDNREWPSGPITISVLANDGDPDGDSIFVQSVGSAGAAGTTQVGAGSTTVVFTPAAGYSSAQFTYTIHDGRGGTSQAVVRVGGSAVNSVDVLPKCTHLTCSFVVVANPAQGIVRYDWQIYPAGGSPGAVVPWFGTLYNYTFAAVNTPYVLDVKAIYASGAVGRYLNPNFQLAAEPVEIDFAVTGTPADGLRTAVKITRANYTFGNATYSIDWGDGTGVSGFGSPMLATPLNHVETHDYRDPGEYEVRMTVTPNGGGQSGRSSYAIKVSNVPPTPRMTWTQVPSNDWYNVTLDPRTTTDDYFYLNFDVRYHWTFSDGFVATSSSEDGNYGRLVRPMKGGRHSVTLNVTDRHGASASQTFEILLPNRPPEASLRTTCEGLHCKLDARHTWDLDGNVKEYRWKTYEKDWVTTRPESEFTYSIYGRHPIEVTVVDEEGATSKTSRIMHVRPPVTAPRLTFYSLPPCRAYDVTIPRGTANTLALAGKCNIPASAVAVETNLVIDHARAFGHIAAWPAGTAMPETSVLNFPANVPISNNATLTLGSGGAVNFAMSIWLPQGDPAPTRFIVDVTGYWAAAGTPPVFPANGPLFYYSWPCVQKGPDNVTERTLTNSTIVRVAAPADRLCGETAAVNAVVMQTEARQTAALGNVDLFGFTETSPPTSMFNIPAAGRDVTGTGIVRTNGQAYDGYSIRYVGAGATATARVKSTVMGIFAPKRPAAYADKPLSFVPIEPCRVLDTRSAEFGYPHYSQSKNSYSRYISIGGNCGMPLKVEAVRANVTVVQAPTAGRFVSFEEGLNLWLTPGDTTANGVFARTFNRDAYGDTPAAVTFGGLDLENKPNNANYIVDVVGYFVEEPVQ